MLKSVGNAVERERCTVSWRYEAIGQLLESGSVAFQVPEGARTTGGRRREEVCAMTAC